MTPIPMEWIDKLFTCMAQFYGERWTKPLEKAHMMDFHKTIWQSGLSGLNYEQIKAQLIRYKRHAQDTNAIPPVVMDFYHCAKEHIDPRNNANPDVRKVGHSEISRHHMDEIRNKLNMTA